MKKIFSLIVILAVMAGAVFGVVMVWANVKASQVELVPLEAAGSTVVLASDGKPIGKIASAEAGKALDGKQISPLIRHAHMAAEDRGFYTHGAISLTGLAWATMTNARSGSLAAGGSTITQQLAKRYAGNEKTIARKLNELPYAYRLEQDYSKDELLTMYVNANLYGRGAYGIEDAARTWFGVSATEISDMNDPLQVARAAFLASLIKQPSVYDDFEGQPSNLVYADDVWGRTGYVLDGLREVEGSPELVSQDVIDKAKQLLPLKLTNTVKATGRTVEGDQYIMRYVQDWFAAWQTEIAAQDGLSEDEAKKRGQSVAETLLARGGLKIQTDLDPNAQNRLVEAHRAKLAGPSAAIVLNPRTGGIVAMSGGRDYRADPVNYAIYASRPPGSTVKPFILADAISKDISVKSVFAAPANITIDGPPIWNANRKAAPGCKMTLADAMATSNNPVHIELITGKMANCQDAKLTDIGNDYPISPESVAELLRKSGADTSPVPGRTAPIDISEEPRLGIGASLELSPLKLAVMASTLASGEYRKPYLIREIEGPTGSSIYEYEENPKRVFEEDHVDILNQVLADVYRRGTAQSAQVQGHPLAGKTGTTDTDLGDSWGFAYNPVNPASSKHKKEAAYVFAGWGGENTDQSGLDVMKVAQQFFGGMLEGRPTVEFRKADMDAGKVIGLNTQADPPPPPPTTAEAPKPSPSAPPVTTPAEETKTPSTSAEPRPSGPPPATSSRSVPPPDSGGTNDVEVPVPGIPG